LTNIIFEKKKDCSIKYDDFVKSCTNLNEKIKNCENLGDTYLIGHAFFSEIVDIYEKVNDLGLAKKILWEISIEPTLEAYCGTMDYNTKTDFINECKKAFMPDK
jgi:5-methylcytosine-specific restriction protein B